MKRRHGRWVRRRGEPRPLKVRIEGRKLQADVQRAYIEHILRVLDGTAKPRLIDDTSDLFML